MVAQHTGQYDDDLTVGAEEYKESFSTDFVDLFEPLGDDDAPIAKLKTIILSIDWEITDDILDQLNVELLDLKDVWSGNKINLIYVQALEKIGRYIYSEKAHSHPSAIKLLLAFYYNLEKIVSSDSMTEEQKKQLLLQDIKKFDHFKAQVDSAREKKDSGAQPHAQPAIGVSAAEDSSFFQEQLKSLTALKASVVAIDGKIREQELVQLSQEVSRLEKIFNESKAKLILLQGLGALANYILLNKSSAHPEAFKLLHSFYQGLERIHAEVLSVDQEKAILVAEVQKFKAFKALIATIATEVVVAADDSEPAEDDEDKDESGDIDITPAFADMPADSRGFRDDSEPLRNDINNRLASFFGEKEAEAAEPLVEVSDQTANIVSEDCGIDSRLDSLFGEDEAVESGAEASDLALSGVNVETEEDDDSNEMALPVQRGKLAPALVDISEQSLYAAEEASPQSPPPASFNHEPFIPGLDVESDADDDSEEAALPFDHQGVAPALVFSDEEYGFRESEFAADPDEGESDLEDRLDSFFGPEITESIQDNIPQAIADEESGPAIMSASLRPELEEEPAPEILGSDEEESPVTSESERAEEQELLGAETSVDTYEFTPIVTDILFDEVAEEKPASVGKDLEVVFEPVGDDVEVDELPLEIGDKAADPGSAATRASLAALHDSIAAILVKKYDAGFSLFFTEINNLYQSRQAQHINNIFLQLLETVGRYIETYRERADLESLSLFQSLDHNLEHVFEPTASNNSERQQILFEETGKVLLWQQRLIFSLAAQPGREEE